VRTINALVLLADLMAASARARCTWTASRAIANIATVPPFAQAPSLDYSLILLAKEERML